MKTTEAKTKPERQKRHPLRTLSDFVVRIWFVIRISLLSQLYYWLRYVNHQSQIKE